MNKQKSISYITFNDLYSGIFNSQVLEVLKLYEKNNINIRLISFVSIRFYFFEKKKIKKHYNHSIIIPIIFGLKYWSLYRFILFFLIYNDKFVICRGIFSANLVLISKRKKCKIIYDGRGAINAEQIEYTFTDVGASFITQASETFKDYPSIIVNNLVLFASNLLNYREHAFSEFTLNVRQKFHLFIP